MAAHLGHILKIGAAVERRMVVAARRRPSQLTRIRLAAVRRAVAQLGPVPEVYAAEAAKHLSPVDDPVDDHMGQRRVSKITWRDV